MEEHALPSQALFQLDASGHLAGALAGSVVSLHLHFDWSKPQLMSCFIEENCGLENSPCIMKGNISIPHAMVQ